eukprot:9456247-Alexandrium_andersonii.AAC.1
MGSIKSSIPSRSRFAPSLPLHSPASDRLQVLIGPLVHYHTASCPRKCSSRPAAVAARRRSGGRVRGR